MKIQWAFVWLLMTVACSHQREGGQLVGSFSKPLKGTVFLELATGDGYQIVDSCVVDDHGKFVLQPVSANEELYRLNLFGKLKVELPIGSQPVSFTSDGNLAAGQYTLSETPDAEALNLSHLLAQQYKVDQDLLSQKLKNARQENDTTTIKKCLKIHEKSDRDFADTLKQILINSEGSLAAFIILRNNFDIEQNLELYQETLDKVLAAHPSSDPVQAFYRQFKDIKRLSIGAIAPDFSLPNPDGKEIALHEFRGKYVLIDFWASWCHPCRQENPAWVKVYNDFAGERFEILGVSFDRVRDRWLKAIEEDHLPWPQVSDLKYFDSPLIELYSISGIPVNYLLDSKGRIIAKNLKPEELESILNDQF